MLRHPPFECDCDALDRTNSSRDLKQSHGVLRTHIVWDVYLQQPSLSPNPVSRYKCDPFLNPAAAAAADRGWRGFFPLLSQTQLERGCSRQKLESESKDGLMAAVDFPFGIYPSPHQTNKCISHKSGQTLASSHSVRVPMEVCHSVRGKTFFSNITPVAF